MEKIERRNEDGSLWVVTLKQDEDSRIIKASALRGGEFWIEETVTLDLIEDPEGCKYWLEHLEHIYQNAMLSRGSRQACVIKPRRTP